MIIWINGAFGVGKSHTANELFRRIDNTFLFDPEEVGFFLRKFLPNANKYDDFQNMPLWRQQVLEDLLFCEQQQVITIVPMTIVEDEIFDFIIGGIKNSGGEIRHFSLMASKATIEQRLTDRGDKDTWAFKQIDRCINNLAKEKYAIHIDAETNDINQVVELIATLTGQPLQSPVL